MLPHGSLNHPAAGPPIYWLSARRCLIFPGTEMGRISMTKSRVSVLAAGIVALALGFAFAGSALAQTAKTGRTAISKACSAQADEKKLHGKERRTFRRKCIADAKKKPTT
jgi:hypothetical protein